MPDSLHCNELCQSLLPLSDECWVWAENSRGGFCARGRFYVQKVLTWQICSAGSLAQAAKARHKRARPFTLWSALWVQKTQAPGVQPWRPWEHCWHREENPTSLLSASTMTRDHFKAKSRLFAFVDVDVKWHKVGMRCVRGYQLSFTATRVCSVDPAGLLAAPARAPLETSSCNPRCAKASFTFATFP